MAAQVDDQPSLFELPPRRVEAAPTDRAQQALAQELPPSLYLGTMSWSFPGWRGLVYGQSAEPKHLADAGLGAYSQHPLLGAVEVDRSFYEPLPPRYFESLSRQVPDGFRFLVKAHEECTLPRFPKHARYGKKQGDANRRFLDAAYAADAVVGPSAALGEKLGGLLFQFPPQDASAPFEFAERLGAFLSALPPGLPYVVEVRNPELLTPAYARALEQSGALHAHNVWGSMPSVLQQARLIPPAARRPLVVRWLMRRGDDYEGARSRYAPFSKLAEPDLPNRRDIASLVAKALAHHVPAFVLVNNKAEGCAPESLAELARLLVATAPFSYPGALPRSARRASGG